MLDPKRCRTEQDTLLEENGPVTMQTDVPDQLNQNKGENVPKNLISAGSRNQARLVEWVIHVQFDFLKKSSKNISPH